MVTFWNYADVHPVLGLVYAVLVCITIAYASEQLGNWGKK